MRFTFDAAMTATLYVEADSLADAVDAVREARGVCLDAPLGDADVTVHQLDFGSNITLHGGARYDGELLCIEPFGQFGITADMDTPELCSTCGELYDEARGDGYNGRCPSCANKETR